MGHGFAAVYGRQAQYQIAVPGRVNLLGEWIDFSGGLVLPMALPLHLHVSLARNDQGIDRIASAQFEGVVERKPGSPASGHWSDYVAGALTKARALGWASELRHDVWLDSEIPHGSGLSSSAAVIVGVLKCLAPEETSRSEIAIIAQEIENRFIGIPCGIMDQMAVAIATPETVLALDTGTLDFREVALPAGWRISIVHSGVSRKLADGRYKVRRDEILAAAKALDIKELCKADPEQLEGLPPVYMRRARHVISEDRRTRKAERFLLEGDIESFGAAMREGQHSIRCDLEVTTPEIDAQVALIENHGAVAARQTGGGFGGCLVVLDHSESAGGWWDALVSQFPDVRRIV